MRPSTIERQGRSGEFGYFGVGPHRGFVDELLDPQPGGFTAPAPAGPECQQQQRAIAGVDEPIRAAGRQQFLKDRFGDGALALAGPGARGGANRETQRGAQRRGGERAVNTFPAVQGRPMGEPSLDGCGRVRLVDAQQASVLQRRRDFGWHAVGRIGLAFGRIPKMMRDELERQRLGRRPGQGGFGRGERPGLEIREIGGERPQGVFANAFACQVLEGLDIIIGEEPGEPIAPVHGQDRRERIEFERAPGLRIRKSVRGGASCHYIYLVPQEASSTRARWAGSVSRITSRAPKPWPPAADRRRTCRDRTDSAPPGTPA